MPRRIPFETLTGYLTIGGKALTTHNLTLPSSILTGAITSFPIYTDPIFAEEFNQLAINVTVMSVAGGTGPTLDLYLLVMDPMEPTNDVDAPGTTTNPPLAVLHLTASALSSFPAVVRVVINRAGLTVWVNGAKTDLGNIGVPTMSGLKIVVTGAPTGVSLVGSFEGRR